MTQVWIHLLIIYKKYSYYLIVFIWSIDNNTLRTRDAEKGVLYKNELSICLNNTECMFVLVPLSNSKCRKA
jgi:hypothetical protein